MPSNRWRSIRIELASDRSAAPLAADVVRVLCRGVGLVPERTAEVELALVEAVNNAVEHANRFDETRYVVLALEHTPAALVLRISDDGQPMSREVLTHARSAMDHIPTCSLEELPQRGMGLSIMKMAMDSVSYESDGRWNVLTMRKLLAV